MATMHRNVKVGDILYRNYTPTKLAAVLELGDWEQVHSGSFMRKVKLLSSKGVVFFSAQHRDSTNSTWVSPIEDYSSSIDDLINDHQKKINTHTSNSEKMKKLYLEVTSANS